MSSEKGTVAYYGCAYVMYRHCLLPCFLIGACAAVAMVLGISGSTICNASGWVAMLAILLIWIANGVELCRERQNESKPHDQVTPVPTADDVQAARGASICCQLICPTSRFGIGVEIVKFVCWIMCMIVLRTDTCSNEASSIHACLYMFIIATFMEYILLWILLALMCLYPSETTSIMHDLGRGSKPNSQEPPPAYMA